MDPRPLLHRINAGEFEALDIGCGAGASVAFVRKQLGYRRIAGIELDAKKVCAAREAGVEVLEADATTAPLAAGVVEACFMFHFLEHLRTLAEARAVLLQACRAARGFVLIRQPFFGADERLVQLGLKLAWSTWRAHANKMTTLDFHTLLRELQKKGIVKDFMIHYAIPIESSADTQIIPLDTGSEELFYDEAKHGPKVVAPLAGVYREICVVAKIGSEIPLQRIEAAARASHRVYPLG